jgi:hypothetical protein
MTAEDRRELDPGRHLPEVYDAPATLWQQPFRLNTCFFSVPIREIRVYVVLSPFGHLSD